MSRGGLKIPEDAGCQWVAPLIVCFIMMFTIKNHKDFSEHIADYYIHGYSACEDHFRRRLANILLNNYRSASTPRLGK